MNKRDTRVEVLLDLGSEAFTDAQRALLRSRLASRIDAEGWLRVVASNERTQAANRAAAMRRLGDLLERGLRPPPPPRRATRPSRGATERRLADKRARGAIKRQRNAPADD